MVKKLYVPVSFLLVMAAVFWSFYGTKPHEEANSQKPEYQFSTSRAFQHVEALAVTPHYVGTSAHEEVQDYIVSELEKLDLAVEIQETASVSKTGVSVRPQNILTRIEGSGEGKALLLLTHYDSAVHSSPGASDAASGVATILEGIRTFLVSKEEPLNDIIILFTDAEELGLNGALSFVEKHPWAQDVGLALNFEARGSGGNSFMLLETNGGNQDLIEHFIKADPKYPVTNSLAYSVYKMLPNDTDLTVLREEAGINGLNFAFIDDHYDYHTANDTPENLDFNTLAHQGSYLMPLLNYFSQTSLDDLNTKEDLIYFNVPIFQMITYPFSWIMPMLVLAWILFLVLLVYGFVKKGMGKSIVKGILPLLISLSASGILTYFFWQFCLFIYPQYLEMEHGFTYNGYLYITAVILLSLGISFYTYHRFKKENVGGVLVAPLFLWLVICTLAALFLKGAAYFVVPVFFGLLQLFVLLRKEKPNLLLLTFLSLPSIFILMPFITTFPVALGLNILFLSAVLVVLLWTLLWPVFGFYRKIQFLGFLSILGFFILVGVAHFSSEFNEERPKPNSLVYLYDADEGTATWNTYDTMLDEWTMNFFGETYIEGDGDMNFSSKYNTGFAKTSRAPLIPIREPNVIVQKISGDSVGNQHFRVKIIPQREINRIEIFTDEIIDFPEFKVNGITGNPLSNDENSLHVFHRRWTERLLTHFATGKDTLTLEFTTEKDELPEFIIYEASHDLLKNELLKVPARKADMIPRPFVLNDAVILKKRISLDSLSR